MGNDFRKSLPNPQKSFLSQLIEIMPWMDLKWMKTTCWIVSFYRFMKGVAKATKLLAIENAGDSNYHEFADNKKCLLYLKIDKEMTKVILDEILYVESRKEYTMIYLTDKKPVLVKQSISAMEKLYQPINSFAYTGLYCDYWKNILLYSGYINVGIYNFRWKII